MPLPSTDVRRGYTLVEVLVVVANIGLLSALLFPAVQVAREAGRRNTCSSNLRQLGLAIANYEATHRMLPPGSSLSKSLFVNLLPYLGQKQLFDRVDYSQRKGADFLTEHSLGVFLCPSDGASRWLIAGEHKRAGTNYAACCGYWAAETGFNGLFRTLLPFGPFDSGPIRVADVTDGLSNTAAVSELLRSNGQPWRLRTIWQTPEVFDRGEAEKFRERCAGLPPNPAGVGWRGNRWERGTPWHRGIHTQTIYNHLLTPNNPTCLNRTSVPTAASTACSSHPGGVHLLYGDGHLKFIADQVDREVWQLLSGRNDGK